MPFDLRHTGAALLGDVPLRFVLYFAIVHWLLLSCDTVGRGLAPAETYGLRLERREQAPALRCIVNLHKPMVSDAMYVLPTMCVGHDDPACHKIRA